MADAIYPKYKEALLSGAADVALDTSNVVVSLVDRQVTPFSVTDQYFSDLNENGVDGANQLSNTSVTDGVFKADPVEVEITSNTESEAILLWINTGNTETSRLVAWLDESVIGLPIIPEFPNDAFIDITWNESGIFKL